MNSRDARGLSVRPTRTWSAPSSDGLVEEVDARLERAHLLALHLLVHALPFRTTRVGLVAALLEGLGGVRRCGGNGGLLGLDDGVPKLAEDVCWKCVNLKLNFVSRLDELIVSA